jgi:hypothetical protein
MTILFGYSILPARIILTIGIFSLLLSIFIIILFVFGIISDLGIFINIFLGGVQLTSLGVIGEYVSKAFLSQNQAPQYVEK